MRRWVLMSAAAVAAAAAMAGCERERRDYHQLPGPRHESVRLTDLVPGEPQPSSPPDPRSPFQANAYGMGEGKRLFSAYNCTGCHAQGGGSIGPPLMDDQWIYGASPNQIYLSIVQGRPDGMPAFGGRIPDQQVWQIVAYVQSMSGQTPRHAAAGRDDDMATKKAESRKEAEVPKQTGHR